MRTAFVLTMVVIGSAALAWDAEAGTRYARAPQPDDVYVAEGRGCYWYRGAMTCSRYCYLEVDGRRYCRERSSEAFPQHLGYYWSQMYGGRPDRWRPPVEVAPDYRGRRWINAPRRDVD
jgi:hypothetical protein